MGSVLEHQVDHVIETQREASQKTSMKDVSFIVIGVCIIAGSELIARAIHNASMAQMAIVEQLTLRSVELKEPS